MSFDSDVAVLGTGIAPLIAANLLLNQGKTVLLLNPDWDFFLEDSELPLDPLLPKVPTPLRLSRNLPTPTLATLRPLFPGAIEFWHADIQQYGFHDPDAPHVRQRGRLWISAKEESPSSKWGELEKLYLEASDAGLNPQLLEGPSVLNRFPGLHSHSKDLSGLFIPRICDVDVVRYRNGLLEFIRERLGPKRVLTRTQEIEWMPGGIRFSSEGTQNTARLKDGMLVFWTPRLSPWIFYQAKKKSIVPQLPQGARLWEQWILDLERPLDPNAVTIYEDMVFWANVEGFPDTTETIERTSPKIQGLGRPHRKGDKRPYFPELAVLRAGPLVDLKALQLPDVNLNWASTESFQALTRLCHDLLQRERFTIRALRTKAIFEWEHEQSWTLSNEEPSVRVISACDGPLVEIIRVVKNACENLLSENLGEPYSS